MDTKMRNRSIAAALVIGVLVPAAPAAANVSAPFDDGPQATRTDATHNDDSGALVLRRDGSESAPFVAEVGPAPAITPADGFDWGDAALGAGASLLVVALVTGGSAALGGRRSRTPSPAGAASQQA